MSMSIFYNLSVALARCTCSDCFTQSKVSISGIGMCCAAMTVITQTTYCVGAFCLCN